MKLIRYVDADGVPGYASLGKDGQYFKVNRNEEEILEISGENAEIAGILAPVIPPAIYCVGINYAAHAKETGSKRGDYPVIFMKAPTAVQSPEQPIVIPRYLRSDKVDYEGELAVVIGKSCKNVTPEEALDYVLGYTIANDVSARDWQKEKGGGQFCRGKTFDTFCPLGPALVSAEDIENPNDLEIQTRVNGELMQDGKTRDMIYDVPTVISFLSGSNTLLPGTVILTGTPDGVGAAQDPPRFLKEGDQVEITISGIGTLVNPVIEEAI
ncbi:MAG: fumarylacetoacetate hydrolase family protein [Verrucomicrobia bacterium]|nr:fumarylacetoacetate hydrolase family protein [Verrucomicrobiota bacterium]